MGNLVSVTPEIKELEPKILVGIKKEVSVLTMDNVTHWKNFVSRKDEIVNPIKGEYYSVQYYGKEYSFVNFNPAATFNKWAAIAVTNAEQVPTGMQVLELKGGLYAVFLYQGMAKDFSTAFQYIFTKWLPRSGYQLDQRPHFEFLDDRYLGAANPDSVEEVWIPIKNKKH